ncbi:hypothetical protein N7461_006599 [Penicillium sp. DV-2018c]|nr:hypothetical protein N7461_006599 [Penicillium sp. DV-2018c]
MDSKNTSSIQDADSIITRDFSSIPPESPRSFQEHQEHHGQQDRQDRSGQRKISPDFDTKAGENRLRPAGGKQHSAQPSYDCTTKVSPLMIDIINRIIWDSAFDPSDYVIGFVDRFEGQLEITMGSWKKETTDEEFIPQHRVLYIRHTDGEIVWDRRRRIDKIFWSGNSAFKELAFLA